MFAFGGGSRLGEENRLQDTFRNTFGTGIQEDSFKKNPNTLQFWAGPWHLPVGI